MKEVPGSLFWWRGSDGLSHRHLLLELDKLYDFFP